MGSTVRLCIPEPDLDEWSQRGSRIDGCVAPYVTPISGCVCRYAMIRVVLHAPVRRWSNG